MRVQFYRLSTVGARFILVMMTEATLGEGNTPLVRSVQIGPRAGLQSLFFKLESCNPSGSYKDRFIAAQIGEMRARGVRSCLATSSGNTGSCAGGLLRALRDRMHGRCERARARRQTGADAGAWRACDSRSGIRYISRSNNKCLLRARAVFQ